MSQRIVLLGGGGMATACGLVLAERSDVDITLWCRRRDGAEHIAKSRENPHLPGVRLPALIKESADPNCLEAGDWIVVAIPTKYLRETITPFGGLVGDGTPVISVVKGLELGTLDRPSEIMLDGSRTGSTSW